MTEILRAFLYWIPVIADLCSLAVYVLIQFGLLLRADKIKTIFDYFDFLIGKHLPVVVFSMVASVLVFIFYELFILNWGTSVSLIFMLISYYVFPVVAVVVLLVIVKKLFSHAPVFREYPMKNVFFVKFFISAAFCILLYFIISSAMNLPFVSVCFIVPFLPLTGILILKALKR